MTRLQKGLWAAVAVAALGAGGLAVTVSRAPEVATSGASSVAAEFELTGHDGVVRTEEDFRGKWTLVFFGFTNCPDICPTTLAEIAQVMDDLGPQAGAVQPLFISVDSDRDTPMELAEYVPQFHPSILGLAGTPEQIEAAAASFKIFYERVPEEAAPDGYTMGHASQVFLFDPDGGFVRLYGNGTPAPEITADLRARIDAHG
ncbi:SCO family protein [Albimonas pacifica]|uniref:Protein SCO1/2 n=1 Tax=Albimonas pacifica TaxID=1114924 RepID=A0A1I3Q2R8_9RHOB|nr:SCO family protein [Albimonas pacifica]SFJ27741.1 protein SCO1/2 [Albimonas pacifica]|tara:strand:+ start:7086 stop:7691 length:606 start_codon:yes stop_codon:yes gene_type:complete